MSNDDVRECGDCGEPIGPDDLVVDGLVVKVGPDPFHAACYLPPAWLNQLREGMRRLPE